LQADTWGLIAGLMGVSSALGGEYEQADRWHMLSVVQAAFLRDPEKFLHRQTKGSCDRVDLLKGRRLAAVVLNFFQPRGAELPQTSTPFCLKCAMSP
jgi:hypothetical protein